MSAKFITQDSFIAGQLDPEVASMPEINAYRSGAQSMVNMHASTKGFAKKRSGTQIVAEVVWGESQLPILNARLFPYRRYDGQYFILADEDTVSGMSGAKTFRLFSTSGTVEETGAGIALAGSASREIDYEVVDDAVVVVHPSILPQSFSYNGIAYGWNPIVFQPPPAYDFQNGNYRENFFTITVDQASGDNNNVLNVSCLEDLGLTSDWVGGQFLGPGNLPGSNPPQPSGLGSAIITEVLTSSSFKASINEAFYIPITDSGTVPATLYTIKQKAFTEAKGYPSCVAYFASRLWLAGSPSLPRHLYGSQPVFLYNFDTGTGDPTDAIDVEAAAFNVDSIVELNAAKSLEIYTPTTELIAPVPQDGGLTPSNFTINPQSPTGSLGVCKVTTFKNFSYFIGRTGNTLMQFAFDNVGESYRATLVNPFSESMVVNPVANALQAATDNSQNNIIYYLNQDDFLRMFMFTFDENSGMGGLSPFTMSNTIVKILDICTVDNVVYLYVNLSDRTLLLKISDDLLNDGKYPIFMDAYNIYDSTDDVVTVSFPAGTTVSVVYEGQYLGDFVVDANHQITVPGIGTTMGNVIVGLLYYTNLQLMPYYYSGDAANFNKKTGSIFVNYYESMDFTVNGALVPYATMADTISGNAPTPKSGVYKTKAVRGWKTNDSLLIEQNSPFDLNITKVQYFVDASTI